MKEGDFEVAECGPGEIDYACGAYCLSCRRGGQLVLVRDWLAWRDSTDRGWNPVEECRVIDVARIRAAKVTLNWCGLIKKIQFILVDHAECVECTTYHVDSIYPWLWRIEKRGIQIQSSLPPRLSIRGVVFEYGVIGLHAVVWLGAMAMMFSGSRIALLLSGTVFGIYALAHYLAVNLIRRFDHEPGPGEYL